MHKSILFRVHFDLNSRTRPNFCLCPSAGSPPLPDHAQRQQGLPGHAGPQGVQGPRVQRLPHQPVLHARGQGEDRRRVPVNHSAHDGGASRDAQPFRAKVLWHGSLRVLKNKV